MSTRRIRASARHIRRPAARLGAASARAGTELVSGSVAVAGLPGKAVTASGGAIADWRSFAIGRHRRYALLAASQGVVGALAGPALAVPLLLELGLGVGPVMLVSTLVLIGPAAQLLVPALLRRSGGNLRALTLGAAAIGETRGLWLAAAALVVAIGVAPHSLLVTALAAGLLVAGVFSGVAGANQQAWFAATMPEPERRFVGPRVAGLAAGTGALALTPAALLIGLSGALPGPGIYALLFAIAGIAGLGELWALAHLPWPGKVTVPKLASSPATDPGRMRNFLSFAALASLGSGLAPYFSAYAIVVLHTPPGAAVAIGAITAATSVIASTIVVARLPGRSASRFLRSSYAALGLAWLALPLAHPANQFSFVVLVLVSVVVTAAASVTALATTERLFRLAPGPGAIAHQGRFVAVTAGSTTAGQLVGAGFLALGPAGFAGFAALAVASGLTRLTAAARLQVSPASDSPTGVWSADELGRKSPSAST